ncbi:hypothetical protein AAG906_037702 [Vitis piasezkii]
MMAMEKQMVMVVVAAVMAVFVAEADDTNDVFDPCSDAKVKRFDGFTFGLAFSTKDSFFFNQTQLSPCDRRLSLSSTNSQLAISNGGYMVAFAGRKYAARSTPVLVADGQHTITSFTLVLEFKKGTLQSFYWKKFGCSKCSKSSAFVCLNEQDCAVKSSHCKNQGGSIDCNISIQLIFSGTDKKLVALNSWYELKNLRQYSLYGLYSNIRDAIIDQYDNFF